MWQRLHFFTNTTSRTGDMHTNLLYFTKSTTRTKYMQKKNLFYLPIAPPRIVDTNICSFATLFFETYFVFLVIYFVIYLFVSNKRQNGWTDWTQFFVVPCVTPRKGLWMIEFSKICFWQNPILESFENPWFF